MGVLRILDLGLNSAVLRYVSRAYGQNDSNEMNIVINTSLVLFCIVGLFAMIITVVIALMSSYFIQAPEDISLFWILILILGADMSISFPMRAFILVKRKFPELRFGASYVMRGEFVIFALK